MKKLGIAGTVLVVIASPALAQKNKGTRLWNLTHNTITHLYLAPTGTNTFGPDQCLNDRDGTVSVDERLRLTGIKTGVYDIKLEDKSGRHCVVRKVRIQEGEIFTLEEKVLSECRK